MRAVEVAETGGPDALSAVERPVPEPGPGEVRIAVEAAGVNFADVEQRRGRYRGGPDPPFVPGIEVVGEVDAVGDGVRDAGADTAGDGDAGDWPVGTAIGDRVAAVPDGGGYAERVVVPAGRLVPAPAALDDPAAAGYPVQWLTAQCALFERAGLAADETVLVNAAAGGLGTAAVQLAAAAGATVIGTASTAAKRELARELGCAHAIDYTDADVPAELQRRTDGAGVDVVLDGVGGRAFDDALDGLATGGRIVSVGAAGGRVPTVATPRLLFENRSVHGFHLATAFDHDPATVRRAAETVGERLASGEAAVQVDRVVDLEGAADAHRRLEERASTGTLVLDV